jgi:NAD dependent epimerase/dehydratase family enzyme
MSQIVLSSQKVSSDKIEREGYVFQFKRVYDAVKNIYD